MVQQRINAFRDFAQQLVAQVLEQLCQEFEREVSQLYEDVEMYRNELLRCAELLGHQLGREKQLHMMLNNMAAHHTSIANSVQVLAQQSPSNQQLHEMVDTMCGQHVDILNSTLHGVTQAHSVAHQNAANARQHQNDMITAENEFARIVQLLRQPSIVERAPDPTWTQLPSLAHVKSPTTSSTRTAGVAPLQAGDWSPSTGQGRLLSSPMQPGSSSNAGTQSPQSFALSVPIVTSSLNIPLPTRPVMYGS